MIVFVCVKKFFKNKYNISLTKTKYCRNKILLFINVYFIH